MKILVAHLMKNSIMIKIGVFVEKDQPLGGVGNSGNTSEPHLHIHAEISKEDDSILLGEGIPITFDDRFLFRNRLVL